MTVDHGRKKLYGTSSKAVPKRKHAARIALANAKVRTCIGCRAAASRAELVRMVVSPEGQIVFDLSGGAFGRGAWTHPTESCLRRAAKVMLSGGRKQKQPADNNPRLEEVRLEAIGSDAKIAGTNDSSQAAPVVPEPGSSSARQVTGPSGVQGQPAGGFDVLLVALAEAANRRASGLVSAAYRSGHLALGGDAAKAEFAVGHARLIILATDARAASKEIWLETAVAKGLVVGWATKSELGALVGREELAVLVVTDEGLARSLREVLVLTTPATSRLAGSALAVARSAVTTSATGSHGLEDSEDG